jgi:AraC-like DNA-binding protein
MTLTNNASILRHLWKLIESYGENPEDLFRQFNVDINIASDPKARIPYVVTEKLWEALIELVNDPDIGFRSADIWHPSTAGPLGYAWLTSATLREAFYRLERYLKIVTESLQCRIQENNGYFKFIHCFNEDVQNIPELIESHLAIILRFCRLNYGDHLNPVSLSLQRSEPLNSGSFFAFFRCPVNFDQLENSMSFAVHLMDEPLLSSNTELALANDQIMMNYLICLEQDSIIEKTKKTIIEQLPSGQISDQTVASALHVSRRTLHRKLHENQTTFRFILNDIRHHLADQYIRDHELNFKEISYLLGFSEMSAFSRAFKRWTGKSPSTYRHQI